MLYTGAVGALFVLTGTLFAIFPGLRVINFAISLFSNEDAGFSEILFEIPSHAFPSTLNSGFFFLFLRAHGRPHEPTPH